jgi:hypothetical protein
VPRIKGSHNAMKTGMLAAEQAFKALAAGRASDELVEYQSAFEKSWVAKELKVVRNAKPLLGKLGTFFGGAVGMFDMWITHLTGGFSVFGTLKHDKTDAASTGLAKDYKPIVYPKPDGVISFDKLSSVFLSATNHEEDQPAHLKLKDPSIPIAVNLPKYGEPARLYCPAGVYEVLYDEQGTRSALPDQRPELRPLQNLRHQGSVAEHRLDHARRRRRPQLSEHVMIRPPDPFDREAFLLACFKSTKAFCRVSRTCGARRNPTG